MMILGVTDAPPALSTCSSWEVKMIIDQCRKLALRAPARVVFPDALDVRVLKAAHYLQQQGLAHPILVASPFALRQSPLANVCR